MFSLLSFVPTSQDRLLTFWAPMHSHLGLNQSWSLSPWTQLDYSALRISKRQFRSMAIRANDDLKRCSTPPQLPNKNSVDELNEEIGPWKSNLSKALIFLVAAAAGAAAIDRSLIVDNQNIIMMLIFTIGYSGIIFEEAHAFSKSGVGLLMAVSLWMVRIMAAPETAVNELHIACGNVSEIVFYLIGAMTIVEIIDAHEGFKLVTDNISTREPRTLLWVVGLFSFFSSSMLDNLTTAIAVVSLLQKLLPSSEYRKILGAVVVIAANAGGAWTPIGDVTTTMLWMHGNISTLSTMKGLFIPSAISLLVPLALMSFSSEVNEAKNDSLLLSSKPRTPHGPLLLAVGVGSLVSVPVLKALIGLPPYMGMLLGLGVVWLLTDAIHHGECASDQFKVPRALSQIDIQGALFFLGILLSVSSLEAAGILRELAGFLDDHVANVQLIAVSLGVISAFVDNVPLVAAVLGMYSLSTFPPDSEFWHLLTYCVGTGGSILVIGSAAGVAYMGMEKVDFFWYMRKVGGVAFVGYLAGIAAFLAARSVHLPIDLQMPLTSSHSFQL